VLIEIAQLREQVSSIAGNLDDVKSSMKEVLVLDRTIAELGVRHEQQARELATQWTRIDALASASAGTERKVDEWVNRGRGAWFVTMFLGAFAQSLVLGAMAWTFNHVRAAEDASLLLGHRVTQLEHEQASKKP